KAGGDLEVRLAPSNPTTGRILAAETGEPIAGAALRLSWIQGPLYQMSYGFDGPVLGTSGADGAFSLNTLRDDSQYFILVQAEGRLGAMLENTFSGGSHIVCLEAPREARVRAVNLSPADLD